MALTPEYSPVSLVTQNPTSTPRAAADLIPQPEITVASSGISCL